MKNKRNSARAFTLIELLTVITVIMILAGFVIVNLSGAQRKARDDKRVSDLHLIASALDQFALDHSRTYPVPSPPAGDFSFIKAEDVAGLLSRYLSPMPTDPLAVRDNTFGYVYVYGENGRNAAVIAGRFEVGGCNFEASSPDLPDAVEWYRNTAGGDICYYVSR